MVPGTSKKSRGLLLFALTGAAFVLWIGLRPGEDVAPDVTPLAPGSATTPDTAPSNPDPSGIGPARVALADVAPTATLPGIDSPFQVRGHVVDLDGAPVPGVGIAIQDQGSRVRATSGEDGSFTLVLTVGSGTLLAVHERWTTVRSCLAVRGRPEEENLLVVAETMPLFGIVVDEEGTALAEAAVEVYVLAEDLAGFEPTWRQTGRLEWWATSDEDGRFHFARAPAVPEAFLRTTRQGFRPDMRALPRDPDEIHRIVLVTTPTPPIVVGTVRYADGRPAPNAHVLLGTARTRSTRTGDFRLTVPWPDPDADLVAALEGFQPAVLPSFGSRLAGDSAPTEAVELTLGPPTLALEGRVVDGSGAPLKGWYVSLAARGGSSIPGEDLDRERLAGATSSRTNKEGHFRIGGLSPEPYVLRTYATPSGTVIESDPLTPPAEDVVLRVPDGLSARWISGRVVDEASQPLEGVRVGVASPTLPHPRRESELQRSPRTVTDPEGRFLLERAPAGWTRLVALSETILPLVVTLPPDVADEVPDLVVTRCLRLRLEARDPAPPDSMGAVDAEGRPLDLWVDGGSRVHAARRITLEDGDSPLLTVDARVRHLILWRNGEELDRVAVDPAATLPVRWR